MKKTVIFVVFFPFYFVAKIEIFWKINFEKKRRLENSDLSSQFFSKQLYCENFLQQYNLTIRLNIEAALKHHPQVSSVIFIRIVELPESLGG